MSVFLTSRVPLAALLTATLAAAFGPSLDCPPKTIRDLDGDGYETYADHFLRFMSYDTNLDMTISAAEYAAHELAKAGSNADGKIDRDEFIAERVKEGRAGVGACTPTADQIAEAGEKFLDRDENSDGFIDQAELSAYFERSKMWAKLSTIQGRLEYFVEKLARENIIVDMKITQEEELAWHYQQSR
ncbi:hypothetical protein EMIHUDRAFT_438318 [Emiliania huxleyi CCMP1516]|uniref:EF-hand domain-containing protein n=2 Tax=Emiliania huxleyi TaxID=2903 RepID=A0A0D3IAV4_EMIH1|nr:hypothetical protein EMIHUDRAFT_438318 [Emiliania huxleyi CCMP1516]EOD08389.1 hypothetical protein EMIHUDRAFT_438318 [Emiliania huxleyi CCMP1516]|eukprot:XP_005760818.1 hypothetical protein EMIHUDRAFT_438318 [Emiliania huxleyi CCMP1516]